MWRSELLVRRSAGVSVIHHAACPSRGGGRCRCAPRWQAEVYVAAERRKLRRNFPTHAEALAWRVDRQRAGRRGDQIVPARMTIAEHGSLLVERMARGTIRTRSGYPYKPSVI